MTAAVAVPGVAPERRAWVEQVMGLPVSVHLRGAGSRSEEADARVQAVYDELRAVDVLFSPYRPDSHVCRIGRGELTVEAAHPLVPEVVALCETARVLTGGSFDAWRPGPDGRRRFDPTGLVKGWAVQRAAKHLAAGLGCDVSINAGGDVAMRPGRDARPWRIGVEDPADPLRVLAVVPVVAGGVATSGTAHRGRHIVDPCDGSAAEEVRSVTVVGPSLLWSDVLATAAFVRGRAGLALVEGLAGYEALVVAADGQLRTSGWPGQPSTELPAFSQGTSSNRQEAGAKILGMSAMQGAGELAQPEARLLVVDDEPNILELLATSLRFAGFEVVTATNGREALAEARRSRPDLVVLDVMMPDMDGFAVVRRMRGEGLNAPVLFLTARDATEDKVTGLTVGGDDYVTKPFSLEEIVARIRAVLRRASGRAAGGRDVPARLVFADIELDDDTHEVWKAGQVVPLSPTEFKLLRYFMQNAGRVLSKAQILDHVWHYDFGGEANVVESYVSYLRRKVDTTEPRLLHTLRGVGYVLRMPRE